MPRKKFTQPGSYTFTVLGAHIGRSKILLTAEAHCMA